MTAALPAPAGWPDVRACPRCTGSGRVQSDPQPIRLSMARQTIVGTWTETLTCPDCGGAGIVAPGAVVQPARGLS